MKLRTKIILWLVIPILFGVFISGIVIYVTVGKEINKEVSLGLQEVATLGAKSVNNYINSNIDRIKLIASKKKLGTDVTEYDRSPSSELKETIYDNILATKDSLEDIESITIIDTNGNVVSSTDKKLEGNNYSNNESFIEGKKNAYATIENNSDGNPALTLSSPMKVDEKQVAVAVAQINLNELIADVDSYKPLGETGDSYIINSDSELISPPKYYNDANFFGKNINTQNANECLDDLKNYQLTNNQSAEAHDQTTFIAPNYNGTNVVSAHGYIPQTNWCFLSELNKSEALAARTQILLVIGIIYALSSFALIMIVIYISGQITKPILKLQKGAKQIADGNLDVRVATDSKDEIGDLSRDFDKMTEAVKESRADIDKKVKEQTQQIQSQIINSNNQQAATLNILEDVDEEKNRVQVERDKISTILQSIGDGVFVVDADCRILIFNPAAENITGYKLDELSGSKYDKFLKFVDEKTGEKKDQFICKALKTGEQQSMKNHTVIIKKNGDKVPVADSAAPLKTKAGDVMGVVVVFRDVTREREADRIKSEFISVASHELRTPMTAIKGFIDMILKGEKGVVSNPVKEYLELAYEGNDRLIKLVNDLLNVSRVEAGRMKFDLVDLHLDKVISSAVRDLQGVAKEQGIKLEFKKPKSKIPIVFAPEDKVTIVLNNLVGNALKFTEKGNVTITVEKVGDSVEVDVSDTGIGMNKQDQDKLFKKFSQLESSTTRTQKGTGLGLYISRQIVNKLGGRIWLKSSVKGKGSTFAFSIPSKGSDKSKKSIYLLKREASEHPDQK